MKKTTILIFATLLLFTAKAQQAHFGVKGGINVSQLNVKDDNSSFNSKIGLNAGLLAHIHASKTWAIQPEVFYSSEGAKQKVGNSDVKINLNYINVPVLLQYMASNGLRFEGGPQIGFLVNAKTKTNNATVANNNFKSTAFSIPLGVGYLTTSGLGFDARYVFGLSNINENKSPTVQSNVFQFGLFYQFNDTKMHHTHR
ncbi:MAG: PorT family protein [Bacteroidota bacterium]|nr:PorT family protein [Bacteroidota bacterium]